MGEVAFPQRAFIQTFDEVPQDYRRLVVAPVLLVGPGSSFLVEGHGVPRYGRT